MNTRLQSPNPRLFALAFLSLGATALANAQIPAAVARPVPEWEPLAPLPGAAPLIVRVEASAIHPNDIYASSTAGLLHSSDRGASWSVQVSWPEGSPDSVFFAVAPTDPARVAIARVQCGPRVSADGGATWWAPADLPSGEYYVGASFDPLVPERLFFSTTSGVWRSEDGGLTFTHVLDTSLDPSPQCWGVSIDRNNHLRMYAHVPQTGLYLSRDGGDTWDLRPLPAGFAGVGKLSVDPTDGRRLLAVDAYHANLSEDEGMSWTAVGDELGFDAIAFDPLDRDRFYASRRHEGLMITSDRGANWTLSTDPGLETLGGTPYAILPSVSNPGEVLTFGYGGAFRSVDSGQTFQRSNNGLEEHALVHSIAVSPFDAAHLVARTGGSVFVSLDAGMSWTESSAGPSLSGYDVIADAAMPGRFYLHTLGDGASTVRRSDDGGHTFYLVNQDSFLYFWHLDPHPNSPDVLFGAGSGVWRSDDGGVTFTDLGFPAGWVWDVAVSPADPSVIYTSKSTHPYASHDGGATWIPATAPLPGIIRDLEADHLNPDRAWACVPDHGLYRTDDGGLNWIALGPQYEWANSAHQPAASPGLLLVADIVFENVLASVTAGASSFNMHRGLGSSVRTLASSPFEVYAASSAGGVYRLK